MLLNLSVAHLGFPRGWDDFAKIFLKLHEIERIWTPYINPLNPPLLI